MSAAYMRRGVPLTVDRFVRLAGGMTAGGRGLPAGPWHRIADPGSRRYDRTTCGLTLPGELVLTPWVAPIGAQLCGECSELGE